MASPNSPAPLTPPAGPLSESLLLLASSDDCRANFIRSARPIEERFEPPETRDAPKLTVMGVMLKRRDSAPFFRDVYEQHRPAARYCAEYIEEIHENLVRLERERPSSPDYMNVVQRDVSPDMRAIMVDWLVEVAQEYRLTPLTLHLCVRCSACCAGSAPRCCIDSRPMPLQVKYIDMSLRLMTVARSKLQLLGCACMLIAAYVAR